MSQIDGSLNGKIFDYYIISSVHSLVSGICVNRGAGYGLFKFSCYTYIFLSSAPGCSTNINFHNAQSKNYTQRLCFE